MLQLLDRNRCILTMVALSLSLLFSACDGNGHSSSPKLQLLYFMSFSCPGCRQVNPIVQELHTDSANRYSVSGLVFGTPQAQIGPAQRKAGLTFAMQPADKTLAQQYGVRVTPTILLLSGGEVRERYQGVNGVARLKRLVERGVLGQEAGILELLRQPGRFEGKEMTVRGQLVNRDKEEFALSNGVEGIGLGTLVGAEGALRSTSAAPLTNELLGKELQIHGQLQMTRGVPVLMAQRWEVVQ